MGVGAGQDNGLLHIHELICMMWWQMYPFPHTCPVGSVGGAGGVGQGGRCWGVPQGLGGQPSVLHRPSVFPFGFLCHPISPNLSHTGSPSVSFFLCLILFLSSFFLVHWPSHTAHGILVPQPRMEAAPPALEVQSS